MPRAAGADAPFARSRSCRAGRTSDTALWPIWPAQLDIGDPIWPFRPGDQAADEFEASGYTPGSSVLVEELADGELRILPTDRVRELVRRTAEHVVSEHREAMDVLANYDPDDERLPG